MKWCNPPRNFITQGSLLAFPNIIRMKLQILRQSKERSSDIFWNLKSYLIDNQEYSFSRVYISFYKLEQKHFVFFFFFSPVSCMTGLVGKRLMQEKRVLEFLPLGVFLSCSHVELFSLCVFFIESILTWFFSFLITCPVSLLRSFKNNIIENFLYDCYKGHLALTRGWIKW